MHRGPILLDATAMLEAIRVEAWNPLRGAYQIESVETCVEEVLTGPKSPFADIPLRIAAFPHTLKAVHAVSDLQLVAATLRPGPSIDRGELALWAHALGRTDAWGLCGPDRASMRWGYENGYRDRLLSLGKLLSDIGFKPKLPLRAHHEQAWLTDVLNKLALGIL